MQLKNIQRYKFLSDLLETEDIIFAEINMINYLNLDLYDLYLKDMSYYYTK